MHSTRVSCTGAIVVFFLISLILVPSVHSEPVTFYVDDSNTHEPFEGTQQDPYQTISAALPKANDGDTIYVYSGNYQESCTIEHSITLRGENRDSTIIDGAGALATIFVTAPNVVLTGITITNATTYGIKIDQSDVTVSNSKIYSATAGGGTSIQIGIGTKQQVTNLRVEQTIFHGCNQHGIILFETTESQILQNTFYNCQGLGIVIDSATGNTIQGNVFTANIGYGIELSRGASNNEILDNTFIDNGGGISLIQASNSNHIYHNDFLTNDQNAHDAGTNTWYDVISETGNYWDDYTGVDTNGDGIGDTPYAISGGSEDPYPYVLENGWNKLLEIQAPASTSENSLFNVDITVNAQPISLVTVLFNGVTYQTDGSGLVQLRAPNVSQNTPFTITAIKSGYINGTTTITVLNTTATSPTLLLTAPSSVVEGSEFSITIMGNNQPVDNATVLFANVQYTSNRTGQCRLIAPSVNQDTPLIIHAEKTGYLSAEKSILVRNNGNTPADGTLQGYIKTNTDEPLPNVYIVLRSGEHEYETFTDSQGFFTITLPVGTYSLTASKLNYNTGTNPQINIEENTITHASLSLTPLQASTSSSYLSYALESTLNQAIATGDMLATINVYSTRPTSIQTYETEFNVLIAAQTSTSLTLTINGSAEHNGKLIAVLIGAGAFEDLKNLTIIYDNVTLTPLPFDTFFLMNTTDSDGPLLTTLIAPDAQGQSMIYCLLRIPKFSTHSLTIMGTPFTPAQIQQLSWIAIVAAAVITVVATVLAYRRGKEF